MLNLNINVNIPTKNKFPIKLIGVNECLHCGSKGTLQKIDIFGRPSKQDMYPLDHIESSHCNQRYSIEWKEKDGELIPVPVNMSIKQEIVNTMGYFKIRKNGRNDIF